MKNNRIKPHDIICSTALWFTLIIIVLSGCEKDDGRRVVYNQGPAQGSTYSVTYIVQEGVDYRKQIDSILFVIDRSMSLWDTTSVISRLNKGARFFPDSHFMNVLRYSKIVSKESNGAFDVTIAPLVRAWGFGASEKIDLDSAVVDSIRNLIGFTKIMIFEDSLFIPPNVELDMNAIAQGYTVDVIAEFLQSKGIDNYLVEVGGEVRAKGKTIDNRIWSIGIDKPQEEIDSENRFQVIVQLNNKALATSGNYRKFWVDKATGVKYSHTIDPKTGFPSRTRLLSVSIVADNAMKADAYATACMVMGLEEAMEFIQSRKDLEAYFVFSDMFGNWQVWQTEYFTKYSK